LSVDKSRSKYYQFYTDQVWGDKQSMQSKNFCHLNCIRQKTAPVSRCGLTIALYRLILILLELPSLGSFLNGNGNSDCHTNHGVVSCSDQTHHLHMSRYGRRTCKLSVRMHTAQCICH